MANGSIAIQTIADCDVEYIDGLPIEEAISTHPPDLLIIGDLISELGDNPRFANMFTKGSHLLEMSIIFIVQNIQGGPKLCIGK